MIVGTMSTANVAANINFQVLPTIAVQKIIITLAMNADTQKDFLQS